MHHKGAETLSIKRFSRYFQSIEKRYQLPIVQNNLQYLIYHCFAMTLFYVSFKAVQLVHKPSSVEITKPSHLIQKRQHAKSSRCKALPAKCLKECNARRL